MRCGHCLTYMVTVFEGHGGCKATHRPGPSFVWIPVLIMSLSAMKWVPITNPTKIGSRYL